MKNLKTYLLEAADPSELAPIKKHSRVFDAKKLRAIAVSTTRPKQASIIKRVLDGDQYTLVRSWLTRNVLDDLHDTYLRNVPISRQKQGAAIRKWKDAKRARVKAKRDIARAAELKKKAKVELQKAIGVERKASIALIETHGRQPLVLDGVTFDASYSGESIFWTKRGDLMSTKAATK